jgi:urea transporter
MKHSSIYGIALIAGSLGGVVTMIFHPSGADLIGPAEHVIRHNEMMTVVAHSLALVSIPLSLFGYVYLSYRLGWGRAATIAALVAYGFASVAAMGAAVASGFVAPAITRRMPAADESARQVLQTVFHYNGYLNQGFAKVFVVASSVAVILWSITLLKSSGFARIIGVIGCVVGIVSLAAFFGGHLRLNVHGFGLFIFAQSAWAILVGALLCRPEDAARAASSSRS